MHTTTTTVITNCACVWFVFFLRADTIDTNTALASTTAQQGYWRGPTPAAIDASALLRNSHSMQQSRAIPYTAAR